MKDLAGAFSMITNLRVDLRLKLYYEDINSIFLNSETVLFLHQIFLKGLTARMDSWPTLVLGTSLGDAFYSTSF